jgi:hypothetical protein
VGLRLAFECITSVSCGLGKECVASQGELVCGCLVGCVGGLGCYTTLALG